MINALECDTLEKAVQWAKENPPKKCLNPNCLCNKVTQNSKRMQKFKKNDI